MNIFLERHAQHMNVSRDVLRIDGCASSDMSCSVKCCLDVTRNIVHLAEGIFTLFAVAEFFSLADGVMFSTWSTVCLKFRLIWFDVLCAPASSRLGRRMLGYEYVPDSRRAQ